MNPSRAVASTQPFVAMPVITSVLRSLLRRITSSSVPMKPLYRRFGMTGSPGFACSS
jgi:hypothetical protein